MEFNENINIKHYFLAVHTPRKVILIDSNDCVLFFDKKIPCLIYYVLNTNKDNNKNDKIKKQAVVGLK